jgi:acyl carrier protein
MKIAQEVSEFVHDKILQTAGVEVDGSTRLCDVGIASLDVAELLFAAELRFDVQIDPDDMADIHTVADIVQTFVRVLQPNCHLRVVTTDHLADQDNF